ncbi:MAG: Vancomycin B-type resistance protein VanW [uncultured Thermomicrobiales bacterium]|uniref:Vancomycin B-type resistance protein VanW n=1 Tax=uncultured Thermomicrobiales bacterium TaxID=1645740 RepID=A0A6J4U4A7_9BACT|nr:MAG: Vancomycin B-type resistance protein VanW [uncultured Thermomicrobiales bacterium]
MAALLLIATAALLAFRGAYADKVYPAVAVGDVPVGGLPRDAAETRLAERAAALAAQPLRFAAGDRTWTPTLADLGVSLDLEASLGAAYRVGREATAPDRLWSAANLVRNDRAVPFGLRLDLGVLGRWCDGIDAEFGREPRAAALVVEGATVSIEPEVDGIAVDREAVRAAAVAAVAAPSDGVAPLPIVTTPAAIRAADLAGARARVGAALAAPVAVVHEGRRWELAPEDLGRFVAPIVDPARTGADAVTLDLDQPALAAFLSERFAAEIEREPVDALLGWNEGPVVVEEGVDGRAIQAETFAREVTTAFFAPGGTVPVPVEIVKPAVDGTNLDQLGITTLLARGDSNYDGGSFDRDTNVEVGARLLNGTLVPPGGEFSFNGAIGEITADKGYVVSTVVQGERAGRDIGGGICQVSTTVFRAALLAGLPITEWWPHSYRILTYEHDGWGPGYDASILQPEGDPFGGGDLRFANPSDSWLLVESWTTGVHVVVNIYGPDLGYDAQFSETTFDGPFPHEEADLETVNPALPPGTIEQTEWPLDGSEASFTRDVYGPDGELLESRQFFTKFRGRGNVWQVSPDMVGQSPAGG